MHAITIQYLHQTLPLTLLKVQIQLQVHLQVKASPGTAVELEAGTYQVTESNLDSVTPQTCVDRGFDAGRAGIGTGGICLYRL